MQKDVSKELFETALTSESGTFYVDDGGIVLRFEPSEDNQISIGTLRLPKEWKDGVSLDKYGNLHLTGAWFSDDKYGYLRGASTHVEKLEFY